MTVAAMALKGCALKWWLWWYPHHPYVDWESFTIAFLWRFKLECRDVLPVSDEDMEPELEPYRFIAFNNSVVDGATITRDELTTTAQHMKSGAPNLIVSNATCSALFPSDNAFPPVHLLPPSPRPPWLPCVHSRMASERLIFLWQAKRRKTVISGSSQFALFVLLQDTLLYLDRGLRDVGGRLTETLDFVAYHSHHWLVHDQGMMENGVSSKGGHSRSSVETLLQQIYNHFECVALIVHASELKTSMTFIIVLGEAKSFVVSDRTKDVPAFYFIVSNFNVATIDTDISSYVGYVGSLSLLGQASIVVLWALDCGCCGCKLGILLGVPTSNSLFDISTQFWTVTITIIVWGSLFCEVSKITQSVRVSLPLLGQASCWPWVPWSIQNQNNFSFLNDICEAPKRESLTSFMPTILACIINCSLDIFPLSGQRYGVWTFSEIRKYTCHASVSLIASCSQISLVFTVTDKLLLLFCQDLGIPLFFSLIIAWFLQVLICKALLFKLGLESVGVTLTIEGSYLLIAMWFGIDKNTPFVGIKCGSSVFNCNFLLLASSMDYFEHVLASIPHFDLVGKIIFRGVDKVEMDWKLYKHATTSRILFQWTLHYAYVDAILTALVIGAELKEESETVDIWSKQGVNILLQGNGILEILLLKAHKQSLTIVSVEYQLSASLGTIYTS